VSWLGGGLFFVWLCCGFCLVVGAGTGAAGAWGKGGWGVCLGCGWVFRYDALEGLGRDIKAGGVCCATKGGGVGGRRGTSGAWGVSGGSGLCFLWVGEAVCARQQNPSLAQSFAGVG